MNIIAFFSVCFCMLLLVVVVVFFVCFSLSLRSWSCRLTVWKMQFYISVLCLYIHIICIIYTQTEMQTCAQCRNMHIYWRCGCSCCCCWLFLLLLLLSLGFDCIMSAEQNQNNHDATTKVWNKDNKSKWWWAKFICKWIEVELRQWKNSVNSSENPSVSSKFHFRTMYDDNEYWLSEIREICDIEGVNNVHTACQTAAHVYISSNTTI